MRTFNLILALIGAALVANAQTQLSTNKFFTVTVSEEFKKEKFPYSMVSGGSPFQIFGAGKAGFSYHEADRKKSVYGRFNTSLKREKSQVVMHEYGEMEMQVEKTIQIGGNIIEYYTVFDGRAKKQTLYWRNLDPTTMTPSKNRTEVTTRSGKSYDRAGFVIYTSQSPDGSKVVVVMKAPEEKGDGYLYQVFDKDFSLLWEKVPQLSVEGSDIFKTSPRMFFDSRLVNLQVDNDGTVYYIDGYFHKSDTKFRKKEVYAIRMDANSLALTHLGAGTAGINPPYLVLSSAGNPVVVGFYDTDPTGEYGRQNGCYIGYPDFSSGSTLLVFHEFSDQFIRLWQTVEEIKNYDLNLAEGAPPGFRNLKLKHVAVHSDGGVTLVAQNSSAFRTFGNIVLMDLDAEGHMNWANKIPFAQAGIGNQYMGFAMAQTEKNLYFLFNDEKKNADPNWDMKKLHTFEQFANIKDHVATIAVCERHSDGNILRKLAWQHKAVGGTVSPMDRTVQIGNSLFVHIADGGSTERVVEVKLK